MVLHWQVVEGFILPGHPLSCSILPLLSRTEGEIMMKKKVI